MATVEVFYNTEGTHYHVVLIGDDGTELTRRGPYRDGEISDHAWAAHRKNEKKVLWNTKRNR